MAIIFSPDYFKEQFQNGKSIRQIATENFVSPSTVSHIVCDFERLGLLQKIDRCVVPTNLLTDIANGRCSYYEVEKITGKSYRYLRRYVKMIEWKKTGSALGRRPVFFIFCMCYFIVNNSRDNIVITNHILRVIINYTVFELYCFNYQKSVIKKIQFTISRFQKRPRHITYYFKSYGKRVANIYLITIFSMFNRL